VILSDLIAGRLVARYKRFLADVVLENDGEAESQSPITCHIANPGSMLGLANEGARVYVQKAANPKSKLPYSVKLIDLQNETGKDNLVIVDTHLANRLFANFFSLGALHGLAQYTQYKTEQVFEDSRFDFCLSSTDGNTTLGSLPVWLEVKSTTLSSDYPGSIATPQAGLYAMFPDAKTERGRKHLQGLIRAVSLGHRAIQFFMIMRSDCSAFSPCHHIDPAYAAALVEARDRGVEILAQDIKFAWLDSASTGSLSLSISPGKALPCLLERAD
jgi:sugar fermentation stimulation protein A